MAFHSLIAVLDEAPLARIVFADTTSRARERAPARVPRSGGSMIKGAPRTSPGARGNRREPMRHPPARSALALWSHGGHGKWRTGPDQPARRSRLEPESRV